MIDVVIGVARGLSWSDLAVYAISLARSGFRGEKVLFVEGVTDEARGKLKGLGFKVLDFTSPDDIRDKDCGSQEDAVAWMRFNRFRYVPIINFLRNNEDNYRYAIIADVRDLYFQTDPVAWLEANLHRPYRFIGAGECVRIKDQFHNAVWAEHVSPSDFPWLKEEEVLCAGTIAGEARTVENVLVAVHDVLNAIEDIQAGDQGVFNYVVRKHVPFRDVLRVPRTEEGWTATAWPTKHFLPGAYSSDYPPVFNAEDAVVYTPDGVTPFSIVHQYDRDLDWKRRIQTIMEEA